MKCQKVKKESLVANRQQEIIKACEELYETMEYEEISIKEIAKSTSICRSNIYNYYQTKDEIFLPKTPCLPAAPPGSSAARSAPARSAPRP